MSQFHFIPNLYWTSFLFLDSASLHPKVDANGNCETTDEVSFVLLSVQ